MIKLFQKINHLLEEGEDLVLATIISHGGSTPRSVGTKMIVRRDGAIAGTVGGGLVEHEVCRLVPEIFKTRRAQIKLFDLMGATTETTDQMICGGRLEFLFEFLPSDPAVLRMVQNLLAALQKGKSGHLVKSLEAEGNTGQVAFLLLQEGRPVPGAIPNANTWAAELIEKAGQEKNAQIVRIGDRRFFVEPTAVPATVLIFGAGHVSQQAAEFADRVNFRTVVLDDREDFANAQRFPRADRIIVLPSFEQAFAGLEVDEDSYAVIVTRGHVHDKTVLEQALRTKAGYIGMIGSRRKRDMVYQTLLQEGFTQKDIDRVYSPIGLDLGGETPEEIAVSIVAELIKVRAGKGRV